MNRFVKKCFAVIELMGKHDPMFVARFTAMAMVKEDVREIYENKWGGKVKDVRVEDLLAYYFRTYASFLGRSLREAANEQVLDPYEIVGYEAFTGQFEYNREIGGFVPLFENREVTRCMQRFLQESENRCIEDTWDKVRPYIAHNGRGSLVHEFYDQHLYFMRNIETDEIKIGISIHPETRRKQVSAQVRGQVELLHIVPAAGRKSEAQLHRIFNDLNTHLEWFRPGESLERLISDLKDGSCDLQDVLDEYVLAS